jgi:hypothetical protein
MRALAPRIAIPGTSDHRIYWVEPDNFAFRGSFEFTLWRDPGAAGLAIPQAGRTANPQVPEQALWITHTFPGVVKLNPTRWRFPLEAVAVVEQKLLSLGRLREWGIQTDQPELVPDVFPARPVDADQEEFEWQLRALPDTDPATTEWCHILIVRPFAWCAAYVRGQEGPQKSAWFRDATKGGIGSAPFRLDPSGRPMDGVKLNAAQLNSFLEEAANLPEDSFKLFKARWIF